MRSGFLVALVAAALAGCGPTSSDSGAKVEFEVKNNSKRQLTIQPAALTPIAESKPVAEGKLTLLKRDPKGPKFVPSAALLVLEGGKDPDRDLVGIIQFGSNELSNAELSGPVKISLEPNKIFVKFGTRSKVIDYIPKPNVSGDLTLPKDVAEKSDKAAK